jgi:hypothetical protein
MKIHTIILALLLLGSLIFIGFKFNAQLGAADCEPPARCVLRTAMRKLWSDHVLWTREYIISTVANTPDSKDVANRLLRNQEDIGNAIIPYYGTDAGKKLTELLKEHILIAVDVIAAAKNNNVEALKESDTRWHDNAQDIARFLSSANPNWTFEVLKNMLYEHLRLTTEETVARIKKEWAQSIIIFDKVYAQALGMADDLTNGITKQFSKKF